MLNPNSQSSNPITVTSDPVENQQLATKLYVDTADNTKVSKAGDTMTGALFLPIGQSISVPNQVPSKAYVDSVTPTTASQVGVTPAGNIASTNVQSALQEIDNEKLALAGGTMTGTLVLGVATTTSSPGLQASTKAYTDLMGSKRVDQPDPLSLWDLTHNFGRPVNVTVYNENDIVCYGQIEKHPTDPNNTVRIRFTSAFSGYVIVS